MIKPVLAFRLALPALVLLAGAQTPARRPPRIPQPLFSTAYAEALRDINELEPRDAAALEMKRLQAEWNAPVRWPLYLMLIAVVALTVPAVRTYYRERL